MEIYQDIWINGVVQTKGVRDCDGRYRPIQAHCSKYNRPITILDIGANLGYYSFRLSSEFDCISVMVEGAKVYQNALFKLIKQQKCRNRLILLGESLDLEMLQEISKCEHFDVVLAMRVVHHFSEPFSDVIDAIGSLGDFVFLELPTASEDSVRAKDRVQKELENHSQVLKNYRYQEVGNFPIHVGSSMSPLYLMENPKKQTSITQPFYDSPRHIQHTVESTFDNKRLIKQDAIPKRGLLVNEWVPGINLYTYLSIKGIFPDRRTISKSIKEHPLPNDSPLTDIMPWNFILSGDHVSLIDHTSVNNSRGTPFDGNPSYCLLNTALYILLEEQSLQNMPYNQNPIITKKQLIRRTLQEMLSIIKSSIRAGYNCISRLITIVRF